MSETYWLVSTTRNCKTRLVRSAETAERSKYKLIVMDGIRIIPGRDVVITEQDLKAHENQLHALHDRGLLEVRVGNPNGRDYFGEVPSEPAKPAAKVVEPESKAGKETIAAAIPAKQEKVVEVVEVEPVSDKPIDRMNKMELIEYASAVLGLSVDELQGMTKREIVERLG